MSEVQTMSYVTNIRSLKEIENIRKILDGDRDVDYWHLDINNPENKLIIMGKHLDSVVYQLKDKGYIAEID